VKTPTYMHVNDLAIPPFTAHDRSHNHKLAIRGEISYASLISRAVTGDSGEIEFQGGGTGGKGKGKEEDNSPQGLHRAQ
jgi:ADP-ribosylglycohydrolase